MSVAGSEGVRAVLEAAGWHWVRRGGHPEAGKLGGFCKRTELGTLGYLDALLVMQDNGCYLARIWWCLPTWRRLCWVERSPARRHLRSQIEWEKRLRELSALACSEMVRVEAVLRLGGEP